MSTITRGSWINGDRFEITVDVRGSNPLEDDVRQTSPAAYAASVKVAGPCPKLFSGGLSDLPVFTASGVDPAVLRTVPAPQRHALAAEPDRAKVFALVEEFGGFDDIALPHPGWDDAVARVGHWASGRLDPPGSEASVVAAMDAWARTV